MWRDNKELVLHPKVGFLLAHGALGDTITSLPAIAFARKVHHPMMKLTIWTRNDLTKLVETLVPGCDVWPIEHFTEVFNKLPKQEQFPFATNSVHNNTVTRNKCDMVDFGFRSLLDLAPPNREAMNYPTAPLGARTIDVDYAVVSVNNTGPNREFRAVLLTPILAGLLARGIKPVIVGNKDAAVPQLAGQGKYKRVTMLSQYSDVEDAVRAECLDLRNQTSVMELRDLCGHAKAVIGMDGGVLHLAATTEVPIIGGFTSVDPVHRTPYRHAKFGWRFAAVTPPESLECRGCQSHWTLVFGHHFSTCAYNDFLCVDQLRAADFLSQLDALLTGDKQ